MGTPGRTIGKRPKRLRRSSFFAQPASLALTALALLMAALSGVIGFKRGQSKEIPPAAAPVEATAVGASDELLSIQTPARAVARGEKLAEVPLTSVLWPKAQLSSEYVQDLSKYKEAVALTALPRMLPVPSSSLSFSGVNNNQVSESIPPGMRAITVKVDAESALEGWAQSGSFVDVILVRLNKEGEGGLEAKVIAENIRILSAGRSAEPQTTDRLAPKAPSTITLLTSQEDALKILAAAKLGRLTFSLRGSGDSSPTTAIAMQQKGVLGAQAQSRTEYVGMAKGPDGRTYTLGENRKWVAAEKITDVARVAKAKAETSEVEVED